jgi:hypothetical protein
MLPRYWIDGTFADRSGRFDLQVIQEDAFPRARAPLFAMTVLLPSFVASAEAGSAEDPSSPAFTTALARAVIYNISS